jgi:hypothetical protein
LSRAERTTRETTEQRKSPERLAHH